MVSLSWLSVDPSARNAPINSYSVRCNSSHQFTEVIDSVPSLEAAANEEAWYSLNVTELLPYTVYSCEVYANNSGGAGPVAVTTVQTLQDSELLMSLLVCVC